MVILLFPRMYGQSSYRIIIVFTKAIIQVSIELVNDKVDAIN